MARYTRTDPPPPKKSPADPPPHPTIIVRPDGVREEATVAKRVGLSEIDAHNEHDGQTEQLCSA